MTKAAAKHTKDYVRNSQERFNKRGTLSQGGKERVAVLVAVSTRGSRVDSVSDLALLKYLLPSLLRTLECGYIYDIIIGYDADDAFYDTPRGQTTLDSLTKDAKQGDFPLASCAILNLVPIRVDNPRQKPGPVFNEIATTAYHMGADYMYRVNDDTELLTPWTSSFINTLKAFGPPYGVVGPKCNQGNTRILTHDFTNRLHMELFELKYYPSELTDWWLDDWISNVYGNNRTKQLSNVEVIHHTQTSRYEVDNSNREKLEGLTRNGNKRILDWIEEHSRQGGKCL